jgi:hypothetical protein
VRAIEGRPIGDWIKGHRAIGSDMQSITSADNLTVKAPVHLSPYEAMQGKAQDLRRVSRQVLPPPLPVALD